MARGRTNIAGGDYNVGDTVLPANISSINDTYRELWSLDLSSTIYIIRIHKTTGDIVIGAGTSTNRIYRYDKDGNVVGFGADGSFVYAVDIITGGSGDSYSYCGGNSGSVACFDPTVTLVWSYSTGKDVQGMIGIDETKVLVASNEDGLLRLVQNGIISTTATGATALYCLVQDGFGNVYAGSSNGYVYAHDKATRAQKYSVYTGVTGIVDDVAIDKNGYIYAGVAGWLSKINIDSKEVAWKIVVGGTVKTVAVDKEGNAYVGLTTGVIEKYDSGGNKVWGFTQSTGWITGLAVSEDNELYSGDTGDDFLKKHLVDELTGYQITG